MRAIWWISMQRVVCGHKANWSRWVVALPGMSSAGLTEAEIMDLKRWAQAWADDINQRIYRDTVDEDE